MQVDGHLGDKNQNDTEIVPFEGQTGETNDDGAEISTIGGWATDETPGFPMVQ